MDYHLLFTQRSLSDLAQIIGHIAGDDPEAALQFCNGLLDHLDLLGRFPRLGASLRKRSNVRKLVHSPISVYYRLLEGKHLIEVLHVRHGSRVPPSIDQFK